MTDTAATTTNAATPTTDPAASTTDPATTTTDSGRQSLGLPEAVRLVEVGLRDGLQAVPEPLRTEDKVELVTLLIAAGLTEIEAVSFAHPKVLPQLADAAEVMATVPRPAGVRYRGLAPNLRGAQRAAECGLDEVVVVVSADDEVSRRNQGRGTAELVAELPEVARVVQSSGAQLVVAVACSFFAPARGPVPRAERELVVDAAVDAGADGIYLACTSGQEHPGEVHLGVTQTLARHPGLPVGVHLHNRNGLAPANALAAVQAGASWLEGSFAGLGGDLWFPGDPTVLGNAPMEDLIHLFDSVGVRTGIDLAAYLRVVERSVELTGIASTSFVTRGGSRADLATARWPG
ncbi:hydroxymethylglutaryl-CoA lyase [Ornithinimicrobium ciconiae]|uniref:Hydroxymethylglutaryl-CoA lyase n=1 Tax=Ornithinimicrobium ciconiae TaxID=2594265 RepID=A0A516G9W4_9MICO|nr:hydroxymethylglutaryl-CoA lyase [Ornithinimicrobium ciconiae]QDO88319.1 hydroxymethylglutaryl-CoA lyase [Ornithinimicrobium ciconiae]